MVVTIVKYSAILSIGFIVGFIFYHKFKTSMGGVLATPFVVLYTLDDPSLFIVFVFAFLGCIFAIELGKNYFLLYGRRLFYLSISMSLIISAALFILLNPQFSTVFFSITAGIIAYNAHKELMANVHYLKLVYLWFLEFSIIYILGFIIVNIY